MNSDQDTGENSGLNRKVDELIGLVRAGHLDESEKESIHKRLKDALDEPGGSIDDFKPFIELNISEKTSREEVADNLEFLLSQYQLDSKLSKRYILIKKTRNIIQIIISLLLIIMGFSMIFIKAPPNFEMLTIYYFTWNDGITLMDLISLLIVFSGIFLLITALMRFGKHEL